MSISSSSGGGGGASFLGASFFSSFLVSLGASGAGPLEAASTYLTLNPDSRDKAAMFLKALVIIRGIVAEIRYPDSKERPTMFLAPSENLPKRVLGSRLRTSSGRIDPSS
eukprot:TRINITY_DN2327_c0_g1_i1.p1 TRINITY_DN2327_c0_g1~~TRINITY_DN2327_c0_g1_i1.p1  ORF type:complete len:110 (+),score=11.11 TRINITY_DN2327_c0_g1_i1:54-383(+)